MTIELYKQGQRVQMGRGSSIQQKRQVGGIEILDFPQFMLDKENTGNLVGQTGPKTAPNQIWSRNILGDYGQQQCIGNNLIYIVGNRAGENTRVFSFNPENGELENESVQLGEDSGSRGLAYNDGVVYAGVEEFVYAFDADSLSQLWQSPDLGDFTRTIPTYYDGFVYVYPGNEIFKINASTGAIDWQFNMNDPVGEFGSAVAVDGVNNQVISGNSDGDIRAVDIATGNQNWFFFGNNFNGGVTVADGAAFVGHGDRIARLRLTDGNEDWNVFDPNVNPAREAFAYDGDGVIYTDVDFTTQHITKLDKDDGSEVWSSDMDDSSVTWPIHIDGVIYAMDIQGDLYGFDADTGAELFQISAGPSTNSVSLIAASGIIFTLGGTNERIAAFGQLP